MNTTLSSHIAVIKPLNIAEIRLMIVFAFLYVTLSIGVLTFILLYQEEYGAYRHTTNIQDLSDIDIVKILKIYAKFVFTLLFFSIMYRLIKIYNYYSL